MSLSFQDLQEALTLDDRDEFIIWQNSSKRNKRVKRGNLFASKGVTVRGKFIDAESGNDVGFVAASALNSAGVALGIAQGAQTSADGKTKVYYQNDEPTGGTYNAGDLWYDTNDNYKIYVRSGGGWVASFTPFPGIDVSGNVTGLVKATGTESTFALLANKFQIIDPANPATKTDANVPFEIVEGNVRIKNAQIQTVDAGKLTAGFIGAQVIAINGTDAYNQAIASGGYIESTSFVLTWPGANYVEVKAYNAAAANLGKSIPSDVVQVKVVNSTGGYRLFRAKSNQAKSPSQVGPLDAGAGAYWEEKTGNDIPTIPIKISDSITKNVENFGFRIASNGFAEFTGALFRGAVIANEGFFGDSLNAVRLDSKGLTVGNNGYLKSRGVGYNGTSFFATSGTSGGFFLGNTLAEGDPDDLYQLFVGKPTGNNLWWNGENLLINGSLAAFATGTAGTSGFGLTIGSGFGIRYINNTSVLTITGGVENGVANGAQIDLCGSSAAGLGGYLILQAGSGVNSEIRLNTNLGTDTSGKVGATRLSIDSNGLVSIVKSPVATNVYNTGAGNLYVHSNLGVGRTPEEQDAYGDTDGRIWASEEVVVYNMAASPAIRSVILKKTDGAGMVYLRAGDDSVTVTLNGGTGEISASSYNSTSSKRFKKKIKNLKTGLNAINSLRPVTFDWKNKNKQNDIGLIAEEVDKILPMIVSKDERGEASGLDYGKLTTVLIQAVKELSAEVEKLKSKMHYGSARN